jgi:hypothetical protein
MQYEYTINIVLDGDEVALEEIKMGIDHAIFQILNGQEIYNKKVGHKRNSVLKKEAA